MKNSKPKISMVIMSYNGGKRLIPTLESHKLQTYKDKELIISDDASPDGITPKIIEDWLSENEHFFKRVIFIKNEVNVGAVNNFRNAVSHATGDVIFQTEQGDVIYGPETIELISNEIEKQRLNGLRDPYIWLGHFKSFLVKNGVKKEVVFQVSAKRDFDLIEKYPDKALGKMLRANFIGGASLIFSSSYFDGDVFPHPETIKNLGDYPCLLWNLIYKKRIGIIRQFIRWYEFGAGISSRPNEKMNSDVEAMILWLETLSSGLEKRYKDIAVIKKEYGLNCKTHWQRMARHPFIFTGNALKYLMRRFKYIVRRFGEALHHKQRWIIEAEKESSPSFEEEKFSFQYYPDKPDGIF